MEPILSSLETSLSYFECNLQCFNSQMKIAIFALLMVVVLTLVESIWKWEWLGREVCGELVGCHIRKLAEKGKAYCQLCNKDLLYTQRGWKALEQHIRTI